MNMRIGICLMSTVILSCMLAACNQKTDSGTIIEQSESSQVQATIAPESSELSQAQSTPKEATSLSANLAVESKLQVVKSDIFEGFDYFGAFQNGWAFVLKGEQAGYLSEKGEYKPLYTIPLDVLQTANMDEFSALYGKRRSDVYYLTHYFGCNENGIVPYYRDGKWGYSDLDGNIIVEPKYFCVEPLGKVSLAKNTGDPETGSDYDNRYDLLDEKGNVLYTGSRLWADGEKGYYFVDDSIGATLYNADNSIVLEDMPYGVGLRAVPADSKLYVGGVVIEGYKPITSTEDGNVVFDRTGKKIAENLPYEVIYIDEYQNIYCTDGEKTIVLDKNLNEVVIDSISHISNTDEDGVHFIRSRESGKVRQYDGQFNEVPSQPCLIAVKGEESYVDEGTGENVTSIHILDQDNNVVMELESRYKDETYGMYYPSSGGVLTEGDWIYWCPNESTIEVYRVEKVQ